MMSAAYKEPETWNLKLNSSNTS